MEQKLDIYERILCDICGKEINGNNEFIKTIKLCPNREMEKIDVCEQCMQKLFEDWKEEEKNKVEIRKMIEKIEGNKK